MTESRLKYRLGTFLVSSHMLVLATLVVLRMLHGFDGDQFTTILAIIVPMFTGYSTSILTFIVNDRHTKEDKSRPVGKTYIMFAFLFPSLLTLAVISTMLAQARGAVFADYEDFKRFLLSIESVFAAYVGLFVYSLFGKPRPDPGRRRGASG